MKILLLIIVLAVTVVWLFTKSRPTLENYSTVLGTLAPQRRYYNKCINNCARNKSGDSGTGQFKWLCTRDCEIRASKRDGDRPDLTAKEYQRNGPLWDSDLLENDYCLKDIGTLCKERYCPYSNHPNCVKDCVRVRSGDCIGPAVGGWMP